MRFRTIKKPATATERPNVVQAPTPAPTVYLADISPVIEYIKTNELVEATNRDPMVVRRFSSYGCHKEYVLVFKEMSVVLDIYNGSTFSIEGRRDSSEIRVYNNTASPQLELFDYVQPAKLISTLRCVDVSPEQFNELKSFMSATVDRVMYDKHKQHIDSFMENFR